MTQYFLPRYPATYAFNHLVNAMLVACPILLANCSKEILLSFRLIGGLPWLPPKSNKLSLTSSTSYLSDRIFTNRCYTAMLVTSVHWSCSGCWYYFDGSQMGGRPDVLHGGPGSGGVEVEYGSRFNWLFPGGLGGPPNAARDEGPGSVICGGGEYSQPGEITLREVIYLPLWPIIWKSSPFNGCWLLTMHHVECRMLIILWSAWKWLLWRWVVTPLWQMMLIGVFVKSTLCQWQSQNN